MRELQQTLRVIKYEKLLLKNKSADFRVVLTTSQIVSKSDLRLQTLAQARLFT